MCLQMYVAVNFFCCCLVLRIIIHVEEAEGDGLTVSSLLFSSNLARGVHVHASSELRETRRNKETASTGRAAD